MILGIDAHKLNNNFQTGTDAVTYNFVKNLNSNNLADFSRVDLYLKKKLTAPHNINFPDKISSQVISMPYLWSTLALSWRMKWQPPDILFVPSHSLPLIIPTKTAVMIHDIGFLDHPDNYSKKQYYHLVKSTLNDVKRSSIIFTPSEFTKRCIIDRYSADPNKIFVTPLGVDTNYFHSNFSQAQVNKILNKYDQRISKKPFIFYLGRLEPRKNLINMIKSFALFKKNHTSHLLLLAGSGDEMQKKLSILIEELNLTQDVIFLGYLPKQHLPVFYSEADLFLFPSLYEGFGLPILEAQSCRTPVITSNQTSMPEIAGKGAVLVDPLSPEEISSAMKKIIENISLKQNLVEWGLVNVKKYSWINFTNQVLLNLVKLGKKYASA